MRFMVVQDVQTKNSSMGGNVGTVSVGYVEVPDGENIDTVVKDIHQIMVAKDVAFSLRGILDDFKLKEKLECQRSPSAQAART